MKLTSRAALLILPVILVSFLLVAVRVHDAQISSRMALERARFDAQLANLQAAFRSYDALLGGYLNNMRVSDSLKQFLRERNDRFRDVALGQRLEKLIDRSRLNQVGFVSFAVMEAPSRPIFYHENSTDPFAAIRSIQLEFAEQLFGSGQLEGWQHSHEGGKGLLLMGQRIDTRTFAPPLPHDFAHAVMLVAAIEPTEFDTLLASLRESYPLQAEYGEKRDSGSETLRASLKLAPQWNLNIVVKEDYLQAIREDQKALLLLSAAGLSLLTFLVLFLLVKRYITHPISDLDEQLEAILRGDKDNIDFPIGNDEVSRLGSKFHDLYERVSRLLSETRQLSLADALTGLPNRLAFQSSAERLLQIAHATETPLFFIYVDLDNFKFVNDKYGHDVGDQLLQAFVVRLQNLGKILARADQNISLARLSGDEFIMTVTGFNTTELTHFLEKILHLFDCGFQFECGRFPVTVSLGIARFGEDGHTVSQLVSNSDLAMYQAKRCGKNRFEFYSRQLAETSRRRMDIEDQLKAAVFDEEFHLVYMPIVDRRGCIIGCEALLRWESKSLGRVRPDEFVPIAESTGLFEKVDFWVLNEALHSYHLLQQHFGDGFRLAVNISSAHLEGTTFLAKLQEILQKHTVPASAIELEITETFAVQQSLRSLRLLQAIQQLGIRIAIDDFGTGYTSLIQMLDYPADAIKLDKSFIESALAKGEQQFIAALIELCHLQGMTVTAEGVELESQQKILLASGCDHLQGFLYSQPLPLTELRACQASTWRIA